MSFNGSGTFQINSAGQPVVANTVISSTVFNALTADLATGLSTCITKDGQTTVTANIPMGTFKFTNLGNGSAATDSATLGQVQASTAKLVTVSGTDTITGTMTPALTAYSSGQMFYFVSAGANTGAVTLNIDGLGARNVTRTGSTALVAGDIASGQVCLVVYDGTRFQLLNGNSFTNLNVSGVATFAVGAAATPSLAFTGDLNTGLWSPTADTVALSTGGSERWRVDSSGNVGIGTASPSERLEVSGTVAGAVAARVVNLSSDSAAVTRLAMFTQGGTWNINVARSDFSLSFATGSTERMRLDSSGNLGIGTASPGARLDVITGTARWRITNDGSGNVVEEILDSTGAAYRNLNSYALNHILYTSGSERMRIDSSGNLGVGNFSPSYRIDVIGASTIPARFKGNGTISAVILSDNNTVTEGYIGSVGDDIRVVAGTSESLRVRANGSVSAGTASLATTATDGFLYVPTCAGVPTGTPTAITGMAPIVVDTTNNRWYFYSGGAWRNAGP